MANPRQAKARTRIHGQQSTCRQDDELLRTLDGVVHLGPGLAAVLAGLQFRLVEGAPWQQQRSLRRKARRRDLDVKRRLDLLPRCGLVTREVHGREDATE